MGGNLRHSEVPNLPAAQRIPADVYFEILDQLKSLWKSNGGFGVSWAFPHSVREKPDHGDIDILVWGQLMPQFRDELAKLSWVDPETGDSYLAQLQHPESQDSFICTFETSQGEFHVQIDLIPTHENDFMFSMGYFSWNDLGNLIGRIAHRRGLKFGHDGIWYTHRRGDRKLADIRLPLTFFGALTYLGFDADKWKDGFDTFEQMFQYVKDSKYFEECAYPLEHQNHRARTRDAKRKTYNAFLEWINFNGEYVASDKETHIAQMRRDFPGVDNQIVFEEQKDDLRQAYKEKVNGIIVGEYTNVSGKELGALMNYVKQVLPPCEDVLNYSESCIYSGVMFAKELWMADAKVAQVA